MKPFDSSGAFAPSVPRGGSALRSLAVRGAGMTVFSGAVGLAIQIVATVTLGRLLTPRDFGLATMVTTFSILLVNGPANGFYDSILQRKEMTHQLASNLFWINGAIAIVLSAGFVAAGPLLARFYGEAPVARISAGFAVTVLISSAASIHAGLLRRAMRFSALARNDIVARAVGVITSIGMAMAGWGYWALVMGAGALALSTSIGVLILCPWWPSPPRSDPQTRSTLGFATHITSRYSLNYFVRNSDNLLVGWRFGAHALGFYKKAYDLFALSASQLVAATSNVAVSALSRVREDRAQYLRYLMGAMEMMAFIGMGLAGDLTLVGKDLIRMLLGPGWGTAGWIFTFFAPAIGIMMVNGIHGWIHVSLGFADRWLKWSVFEWVVTCSLFLAGLPWGPQGIAVAWCVSFWVLTLPSLWYAGKPIDLGVGPVIAAVWRYTVAALVAGVLAYAAMTRSATLMDAGGTPGAALRLACGTALFGVLYLLAVVILYRGMRPLRTLAKLLRELLSRNKTAPVAIQDASA